MPTVQPTTEQAKRAGDTRWTGGSVLVVGPQELLDQLRQAAGVGPANGELQRAEDYLDALGRLGERSYDAVAGLASGLEDEPLAVARAMHRTAPDTRLLLLLDPQTGHDRGSLEAAGWEVLDGGRGSGDRLAAALEGRVDGPPAVNEHPNGHPVDVRAHAVLPPATDPSSPPVHASDQASGALGDVDLVEAMLDGGDAAGLALRLAAEQSGIAGLELADADEYVPDHHPAVEVALRGQALGVLHAPPPAGEAALRPWAEWLSRWLALDRKLTGLREQASRDELTGVWNRRHFNQALDRILTDAAKRRLQVTVMLFDIDDFKVYNDKYGHAAGDEVLREAARLMQTAVRDHDVVARIGGDEFAVIFWEADEPREQGSRHPQDVLKAAKRFQQALHSHRFPKLLEEAPGTLTISGGLAGYPWDGRDAAELIDHADQMALKSKRQGKNVITFGPGALRNNDE